MANLATPVDWNSVTFRDGFWGQRLAANATRLIPVIDKQCRDTGRFDAFKLQWREGQPNRPHQFWDSDVAKWLEAACRTWSLTQEPALRQRIDEVTSLIISAQQDDGYLNTYFTILAPDRRWTNLRDDHELYCAGHLIEAAVAHFEATGERRLLDALCKYVDLIDQVFGPREGQKRGYPGHEEIELALVKLYRITREPRHLELARFFIDERGRKPYYFDSEHPDESPQRLWPADREPYASHQAHRPVREQRDIEGHAVRALYLLAGMVDLANETGDASLMDACHALWASTTQRRMYITGGVGSTAHGERFTTDYDLPDEAAYAETCAAIALVFAGHRLLQASPSSDVADLVELALFNAVPAGVSVSGDRFFYANPLAVDPASLPFRPGPYAAERQAFFTCACCPPNVARLFADLGRYVYSTAADTAYVHLYADSHAQLELVGQTFTLEQTTQYPWDGHIEIRVTPSTAVEAAIALRLPTWCGQPSLAINGQPFDIAANTTRGYATIRRVWQPGDTITLDLPMQARLIEAHPHCRHAAGKLAVKRGPIVYCFEQQDNGPNLGALSIDADPATTIKPHFEPDLAGGATSLTLAGRRCLDTNWQHTLYRPLGQSEHQPVTLKAVPYALWGNRHPAQEMRVWLARS